jgi:hypothetical protein
VFILALVAAATSAARSQDYPLYAFLAVSAAWLAFQVIRQCGAAAAVANGAIRGCQHVPSESTAEPHMLRPGRVELDRVP